MGIKHPLTFKDTLEIAEAVCTICVSVVALWGTIAASQHDLWRKMVHLIDHYHTAIMAEDFGPKENPPEVVKGGD